MQADRESLRRAVLNLVLNAVDAMPDGGELAVTAVRLPACVELEIADDGPGLSDEAERRAFEPFFTTKSSGIGLGLAIVYRLVESHGGAVIAQQLSRRRRGVHDSFAAPHGLGGRRMNCVPSSRSAATPTATPGRVLVVDDHQQARESVAFTLRQAGYVVQCCRAPSKR